MSDRLCLIIDDEPSIRSYVCAVLHGEHLQTVEADTAAEGIRIVQTLQGHLACIVSDINMPGDMTGVDLAHSVRDSYPSVPVILISGYGVETSKMNGFQVIQKPFLPEAILYAVRQALTQQV
jgi:DNA-binding NtrC family response regulator